MRRLGLLGGTFDPIHLGHLAVGRAAADALHLDEVRLVPSRLPPHRSGPVASGHHRFAMAAIATLDEPGWTVSDEELRRDGPSFTYDTLTSIATEGWTASQIFFLIGADAFAEIATWSRYPAVLDLAHFVVVARQGARLDEVAARVPALAPRVVAPGSPAPASVTHIVPLSTVTPDVSSTDIRARALRGETLQGLVSAPVERYIRRHGLYGAHPER